MNTSKRTYGFFVALAFLLLLFVFTVLYNNNKEANSGQNAAVNASTPVSTENGTAPYNQNPSTREGGSTGNQSTNSISVTNNQNQGTSQNSQ